MRICTGRVNTCALTVIASACAADKDVSKALYERADIPVAKGAVIERGQAFDAAALTRESSASSTVFASPPLSVR